MGPEQSAEAELIARCRAGDGWAFDALVLAHQDLVYAVAMRMLGDPDDATDIAQDAFVRAWRGLAAFRGEAKFSTWVVSIVMNLCRNKRRWHARRRQVTVVSLHGAQDDEGAEMELQVADPSPDPSARALSAERRRQIDAAVAALDSDSRAVIVLRDMHGLAYEEVATALGCELGTVKSRLARARAKLRTLLTGWDHDLR